MRRLFIYYRIASADAAAAQPVARAMQDALCARHPGLQAELWRRPQEKDGMQTWMEIYMHAEGVGPVLEGEIASAAQVLAAWLQGPRHCEVFVPCAW